MKGIGALRWARGLEREGNNERGREAMMLFMPYVNMLLPYVTQTLNPKPHTLVLLPLSNRQEFCIGDRFNLVRHKA